MKLQSWWSCANQQADKKWLVQAAGPAGLRFSIMPKMGSGAEAAAPSAAVGVPVREELGGGSLAALIAAIPFYVEVHYFLTQGKMALLAIIGLTILHFWVAVFSGVISFFGAESPDLAVAHSEYLQFPQLQKSTVLQADVSLHLLILGGSLQILIQASGVSCLMHSFAVSPERAYHHHLVVIFARQLVKAGHAGA